MTFGWLQRPSSAWRSHKWLQKRLPDSTWWPKTGSNGTPGLNKAGKWLKQEDIFKRKTLINFQRGTILYMEICGDMPVHQEGWSWPWKVRKVWGLGSQPGPSPAPSLVPSLVGVCQGQPVLSDCATCDGGERVWRRFCCLNHPVAWLLWWVSDGPLSWILLVQDNGRTLQQLLYHSC